MIFFDNNPIPPAILANLLHKYTVSADENNTIYVDELPTGNLYLNVPATYPGANNRLLVEISQQRLLVLSSGEMPVSLPILNPENRIVYAAMLDASGSITKLSCANPLLTEIQLPFSSDLAVNFNLMTPLATFNAMQLAKSRHKVVIEIHLDAPTLKSNLKFWSIKTFLVPFTELVKTAIADKNKSIPIKNIDKIINIGFTKIEIGSLHALCDFNYEVDLFGDSMVVQNMMNLYHLFQADDEAELINNLQNFENKKIIPEYLNILKPIIKQKASFNTSMNTPNGISLETLFTHDRAHRIKSIIQSKVPDTEYEETVSGILTRIDFEHKNKPGFALRSTTDSQVYCGTITKELQPAMAEQEYNFLNKEYECRLRVTYYPETPKNKEKYEYILLDIKDIQ